MKKHPNASLLSPRLAHYFEDYAAYHKTPGNKWTHYLGITLIVVSLLGFFGQCWVVNGLTTSDYFRLDGGTVLLGLALVWYSYVDWKIAGPFMLVLTGLYFLGRTMSLSTNAVLFVVGWIFQGIGHAVYEKKAPAFLKNGLHLLTGPIWIFARIVGYR